MQFFIQALDLRLQRRNLVGQCGRAIRNEIRFLFEPAHAIKPGKLGSAPGCQAISRASTADQHENQNAQRREGNRRQRPRQRQPQPAQLGKTFVGQHRNRGWTCFRVTRHPGRRPRQHREFQPRAIPLQAGVFNRRQGTGECPLRTACLRWRGCRGGTRAPGRARAPRRARPGTGLSTASAARRDPRQMPHGPAIPSPHLTRGSNLWCDCTGWRGPRGRWAP